MRPGQAAEAPPGLATEPMRPQSALCSHENRRGPRPFLASSSLFQNIPRKPQLGPRPGDLGPLETSAGILASGEGPSSKNNLLA